MTSSEFDSLINAHIHERMMDSVIVFRMARQLLDLKFKPNEYRMVNLNTETFCLVETRKFRKKFQNLSVSNAKATEEIMHSEDINSSL